MQNLSSLPSAHGISTGIAVQKQIPRRSKSLSEMDCSWDPAGSGLAIEGALQRFPKRSKSLCIAGNREVGLRMSPSLERPQVLGKNCSPAGVVNGFLKKAALDLMMRENGLYISRHSDLEAIEAQRLPTVKDLARVCKTLMTAESPERLDIAAALLPSIRARLLEHIEADAPNESLMGKLKVFGKNYCSVLGGRDLAIDDIMATVNAYFIDRIGRDSALKDSNIAAAALTAVLMLVPTIGKDLPVLVGAIREKRYRDAVMPALSIAAVAAMTLNPTAAAAGWDRASAIAAAAGNALMMTHLPGILQHAYEWSSLKRTSFEPETNPFTEYATNHGLVDQGFHTMLDFLHEFGAQAGFFVLNLKNAIGLADSARNPAVFPILATLLGSFVVDSLRGDQPFSDFAAGREALADSVHESTENHDVRGQAAMYFLQQKISETYGSDYASLMSPELKSSVGRHACRQLGGNTLSDAAEKEFIKALLGRFVTSKQSRDAVHVAVDRIYRFDNFDPAANAGDDRLMTEILRFVQQQRNKDKAFLGSARGITQADHVYRNVIAHAIKCVVFEELAR
ncbi:hypothetical protein [Paraburkholderia humisilvae]